MPLVLRLDRGVTKTRRGSSSIIIMDVVQKLPIRVNEMIESKSFDEGFRSAWFRGKIKRIRNRKGQISCSLEFFDFPDEKLTWTKIYEKSPHMQGKLELMIRPAFPPFFRKSELPKPFPTSDVIAVTNDTWKIGDLVDWWCDTCYWSARVRKMLEDDKFLVDLPELPIGEGRSYIAHSKDLRPSLDWTPQNGWMVPIPEEQDKFSSCVELIHQNNYGNISTSIDMQLDGFLEEIPNSSYTASAESSDRSIFPSKASPREDNNNPLESSNIGDSGHATSRSNVVNIVRATPSEYLDYLERMWIDQTSRTSSLRPSDSIESSIIQLEVLSKKIRWIKSLLKLLDFECSTALMKPSWEFADASSLN